MLFSLQGICQISNSIIDKYIIVLDIQEEYTTNSMSLSASQELMESVNYVIQKADPNKVIYIKSFHKILNVSFSKPVIFVSIDSSDIWNLDSRMEIVNTNIISKEESDVFKVKELTDMLEKNNARDIIVIGLMAEKCVSKSLLGGMELGYNMFTIPEAIAGKTENSKDRAIKKLMKAGVKQINIVE
jgi:nicotinamidase-related amidase